MKSTTTEKNERNRISLESLCRQNYPAWGLVVLLLCYGAGEFVHGQTLDYQLIDNAQPFRVLFPNEACPSEGHGTYLGRPNVVLLAKRRDLTLAENFIYVDKQCNVWTAPKNFTSDGATIPQFFWTFLGGPWDGPYRDAAILHDYECVRKHNSWKVVHRLFFEAMLDAGTELFKAKLMYAAVFHCGPRWDERGGTLPTCSVHPSGLKQLISEMLNRENYLGLDALRAQRTRTKDHELWSMKRIPSNSNASKVPKPMTLDEIETWQPE